MTSVINNDHVDGGQSVPHSKGTKEKATSSSMATTKNATSSSMATTKNATSSSMATIKNATSSSMVTGSSRAVSLSFKTQLTQVTSAGVTNSNDISNQTVIAKDVASSNDSKNAGCSSIFDEVLIKKLKDPKQVSFSILASVFICIPFYLLFNMNLPSYLFATVVLNFAFFFHFLIIDLSDLEFPIFSSLKDWAKMVYSYAVPLEYFMGKIKKRLSSEIQSKIDEKYKNTESKVAELEEKLLHMIELHNSNTENEIEKKVNLVSATLKEELKKEIEKSEEERSKNCTSRIRFLFDDEFSKKITSEINAKMTKMDNFYTLMFNKLKTEFDKKVRVVSAASNEDCKTPTEMLDEYCSKICTSSIQDKSQEEHSKILSEVERRIEAAQKSRIDDLEARLNDRFIKLKMDTQGQLYRLEREFSDELRSKIDEKLKMKTTSLDGLKQMLFLALKNSIKEMENKIEEKFNEVSIPVKDFPKQIEILYEDCRKLCNSRIQDKFQEEVSSISSEIRSLRDAQKSIVSNMETTQHQFKDQIDSKMRLMFLELSNSLSDVKDMKTQIKTIDSKVNTKIRDLFKYSYEENKNRMQAKFTTFIEDMQRNKREKDLAEFLKKEEERNKEVIESSTKKKPHFRSRRIFDGLCNFEINPLPQPRSERTMEHRNQEIQFEDLKKGSCPKLECEKFWSKDFQESSDELDDKEFFFGQFHKQYRPKLPEKEKQFEDLMKGSCSKPYFLNLRDGKNLYSPIHGIKPEHSRNEGNTNKNDQEQVKTEENNEELGNEDDEDDDSFTCSELSEDDEDSDTDPVPSAKSEDKPFEDDKCDSDYSDSKSESDENDENDENDDDNGDNDSCKVEKENKEKQSNNKDNEEQVGVDEEKEESANEDDKGDNSFNCSEFSEDDGSNSDSESEDKSFSDNKCDDRIKRPIEMAAHQTKNMVNEKPLGNVKSKENFGVLTRENEQLHAERIISNLKPRQRLIPTAEELMKLFLSDSDIKVKTNQLTSEACQRDHLIPVQPSDPVLSDSDLNAERNHSNSKPSQPFLRTPEELINSLLSDSDINGKANESTSEACQPCLSIPVQPSDQVLSDSDESFDGEIIKDCDVPSLPYVTS